ncbi:metallophosphoesterase family protein [Bacteroides sp.]
MKSMIIGSLLLLWTVLAQAQQAPAKLTFNRNGEFKIVQFTDMHLGHNIDNGKVAGDMIKEVLDSEKPDLVVFTGDNTTMDEAEQAWEALSEELAKRQTPWTAVLGNHDDEYALKRKEIIDIIRKQPYCVMKNIEEGIEGEGNHVLPIYGSTAKDKVNALLYCIDTNTYSTIKKVKGYGWVGLSQIDWYKRESRRYTQQNGGQPLPALAFFHIPLPEYTQAWESFDTKRYGERNEKECSPNVNSGLFTQMLEGGDVMGTFAGHDHVNDYIATLYDIALGYGRASGGRNSYGDKIPGSRVIVLKEGKREFDTWLREKGNVARLDVCTYPTSFEKKK